MKTSLLSLAIGLMTLLSSPLQASAWTDFPLASGARAVYVSSSEGHDANDGLTPATAKRTLTGTPSPTPTNPNAVLPGGFALVREGAGDHLYLKRGDTFSEPYLVVWNRSGLSSAYPAVLGAYGTGPRPVIDRGSDNGMHISPRTGPTVRHVAVTGIHFRASARDWSRPGFAVTPGTPGIFVGAGGATAFPIVDDVLVEDCKFELLGGGVSLVGPQFDSIRNVRLNRNVFADIYVPNGHTNAVYASNVTGLTVEENLIDGVQRTAIAAGVPNVYDTALSHSVYVQSDTRQVILRDNIMARAFDGGMMRPGGAYLRNLALQVSIGSHHGYMFSASAPIISEGVEASVIGNAVLGAWQYGIQIGNIRQGFAGDNLMLSSGTANGVAFNLIGRTGQDTTPAQIGLHNLTIFHNFVLGREALNAAGPVFSNIAVTQNQFRSPARIVTHIDYEAGDFHYAANRYRSDGASPAWFRVLTTNYDLPGWAAFIPEPDATTAPPIDPATIPSVGTYHAFIGGAPTEAAFLTAAREQSRQNWDQRYMAAPVIIHLRRELGLLGGQ
ncbi:MAG TPA: hypothetical protein VEK57_28060 [Thermoanaerobaculia bacterium]|nr:hypothetical protein [Thermoanaerobaculia bacterium]